MTGWKKLLIPAALVIASGCASTPHERIAVSDQDFEGKPVSIVNDIPFVEQPLRLCGPTALYMAAKPLRPDLSLEETEKIVMSPGASGTYKQDLLSATRRLGLAPYSLESPREIFETLASRKPVILFHKTRFLGKEYWHYSVLTGYDRRTRDFTVHIGNEIHRRMDIEDLLQDWAAGGKWAAVVADPAKIPDSANYSDALENGLTFLRLGEIEAARALGSAMEARWPERFESELVLAEAYLRSNRKPEAVASLRKAAAKAPTNQMISKKLAELNKSSVGKNYSTLQQP